MQLTHTTNLISSAHQPGRPPLGGTVFRRQFRTQKWGLLSVVFNHLRRVPAVRKICYRPVKEESSIPDVRGYSMASNPSTPLDS